MGSFLSVEFFGLPGSGKSTLSHGLGRYLSGRGHAVDETSFHLAHGPGRPRRVARKAILVGAEILRHPAYAFHAIRTIGSTGQPGASVRTKLAFNWLLVSSLLRGPRGGATIALHDQGLFQALWSIGLETGPDAVEAALDKLSGQMPAATLVVLLEAGPRTIRERLAARPESDSRLDRPAGDMDDRLARASDLISLLRGQIEAMARIPGGPGLVVLDGENGRLEANVRHLGERIETMLGEP